MHAMQGPTFRRLPPMQPIAAADESNPCRVVTATSRYRNDPYRAVVTQLAPPSDAADQPPHEVPAEKLALPPRRGQLMRCYTPSLPALGTVAAPPAPLPPPREMRRGREMRRPEPPAGASAAAPPSMEDNTPQQPAVAGRRNPRQAQRSSSQHAAPVSRSESPVPDADMRGGAKIALIQFKRTMMSALYDSAAFAALQVGDSVIVEGDRGEHIATVARLNVRKSKSTPTIILRVATEEDLAQHRLVCEDEALAHETCRAHAHRLGLDSVMSVVDVEFQLDFKKLTVFFRANDPSHFVDFRSLQRALYQHFRCRIWIVDC